MYQINQTIILVIQIKIADQCLKSCCAAVISHRLILSMCHRFLIAAAAVDTVLFLRQIRLYRVHHIGLRCGTDQFRGKLMELFHRLRAVMRRYRADDKRPDRITDKGQVQRSQFLGIGLIEIKCFLY